MLDKKGFDLWADNYDKSVNISDNNNDYPFAGYKQVLNDIFNTIMQKPNSTVLDIGIGTGVLSKKLYDNNHQIVGIDFSNKMLEISRNKMPNAILIEHNFTNSIPEQIQDRLFDFIIFTYSIHHLTDKQKVLLLNSLKKNIKPNGKILIGDVSFETNNNLMLCKKKFSDIWDYEEYYYSYDDIKSQLIYKKISYTQISICSGILNLSC